MSPSLPLAHTDIGNSECKMIICRICLRLWHPHIYTTEILEQGNLLLLLLLVILVRRLQTSQIKWRKYLFISHAGIADVSWYVGQGVSLHWYSGHNASPMPRAERRWGKKTRFCSLPCSVLPMNVYKNPLVLRLERTSPLLKDKSRKKRGNNTSYLAIERSIFHVQVQLSGVQGRNPSLLFVFIFSY